MGVSWYLEFQKLLTFYSKSGHAWGQFFLWNLIFKESWAIWVLLTTRRNSEIKFCPYQSRNFLTMKFYLDLNDVCPLYLSLHDVLQHSVFTNSHHITKVYHFYSHHMTKVFKFSTFKRIYYFCFFCSRVKTSLFFTLPVHDIFSSLL